MVLRVCRGCTALFPPGLARCPQCGADDHYEQGSEDDMPKISKAQGPTYTEETVDLAEEHGEVLPGLAPGELVDDGEGRRALPPAEGQDGGEQLDAEQDYDGWAYGEVQAECKRRGLPATGSHLDLVARLVANDRDSRG